jgi:hypothetical protein
MPPLIILDFKISMMRYIPSTAFLAAMLIACSPSVKESTPMTKSPTPSPYDEDITFLKSYGEVVELSDKNGPSRIAIMPGLQARVMTSTSGGVNPVSYGWINRGLFQSGDTSDHINAFGGEERFWLGPEGGQFSIFFKRGDPFDLEHWHTPALIDLEAYDLLTSTTNAAKFSKSAEITNYSGTVFKLKIDREIELLETKEAFLDLGMSPDTAVNAVAYRTTNSITNTGSSKWSKRSGLLSIWLLGMFNPSPSTTIVIPFNTGSENHLGKIVADDYFGKVPADRLKIIGNLIYFKGDGQYRSKIGLSSLRARDVAASYDSSTTTLTIVKYNKPEGNPEYVNSKWELQKEPYQGDVVNSYNDGPPAPGAKPLGPFYELETSSPAKELAPNQSTTHIQTTFHFQGSRESIDKISRSVLGVSIDQIEKTF